MNNQKNLTVTPNLRAKAFSLIRIYNADKDIRQISDLLLPDVYRDQAFHLGKCPHMF